jgi:hypothetical protein
MQFSEGESSLAPLRGRGQGEGVFECPAGYNPHPGPLPDQGEGAKSTTEDRPREDVRDGLMRRSDSAKARV